MVRALSLSSVLAASACYSPPVQEPGAPPPVASEQLTGLTLSAHENASVCPSANPPLQLVASAQGPDGRSVATPTSHRQGTPWFEEHGLPWPRFRFYASHGTVSPVAFYAPPPDAFALAEQKTVEFTVEDLARPGMRATTTVPVEFRCGASLAFRGQVGADGSNGGGGYPGAPGGSVEISLGRLQSQAHGTLILARVRGPSGVAYHLLAPGGRGISLDLTGGAGGAGGEGARAQINYTDRNRHGDVDHGRISYVGPPGPGGQGGAGGSAVIRVDANDRLLANVVQVFNTGGAGGAAGVNQNGGMFGAAPPAAGPTGPQGPRPQIVHEDPSALFADEIAQGVPILRGTPAGARR